MLCIFHSGSSIGCHKRKPVLLPFAFSTGLQLGEKGDIDLNRTTAETTFGATAGLLLSTAFGGISALGSKATYVPQTKFNQAIINRLNKYDTLDQAIKINSIFF